MNSTKQPYNRNVYATILLPNGVKSQSRTIRKTSLISGIGIETSQTLPVFFLCSTPSKVATRAANAGANQVTKRYIDVFDIVSLPYVTEAFRVTDVAFQVKKCGSITAPQS